MLFFNIISTVVTKNRTGINFPKGLMFVFGGNLIFKKKLVKVNPSSFITKLVYFVIILKYFV